MINKAYSLTLAAFALLASIALSACGGAEGVDSVPPTVEINGAEAANSTMLVNFTFSEAITESSITADDVTVTGATKAASVTKVDSTHWTLVITPTGGPVTVTLGANKFEDLAHNANAESASYTRPIVNFAETGANGYGFGGLVSVGIVNDPVTANVGNKVLKVVKDEAPASETWAGVNIKRFGTEGTPVIAVMDFSVKKTVTLRSYTDADVGTKITMKLEGTSGGAMASEAVTTKKNAWETLTFDFTTPTSGGAFNGAKEYNRVAILPSWTEKGAKASPAISGAKSFYFDDLTYAVLTDPIVAAPVPKRNAANVISIFSGATGYSATEPAGLSYHGGDWGAETVIADVNIDSNAAKKLTNFNYMIIDTNPNKQNVSGYTGVHIDYWTSNVKELCLYLISPGPNQQCKKITSLTGWNSVDIPLTEYASPVDLANVMQIMLTNGSPTENGGALYFDNLYFYKTVEPVGPPTAPTQAAGNVISIYSDANGYAATKPDAMAINPYWYQLGADTQSDVDFSGNLVRKLENINYQGFAWNEISISAYSNLHVDLWTADIISLDVIIVGGADSNPKTITLTKGQWNSVDIPLSTFNGIDKTKITAIKIVATPFGGGTLFMDNLYFWK